MPAPKKRVDHLGVMVHEVRGRTVAIMRMICPGGIMQSPRLVLPRRRHGRMLVEGWQDKETVFLPSHNNLRGCMHRAFASSCQEVGRVAMMRSAESHHFKAEQVLLPNPQCTQVQAYQGNLQLSGFTRNTWYLIYHKSRRDWMDATLCHSKPLM